MELFQDCLFSIVVPMYNGEQTLCKCLDSIFSQQLDDSLFEVICIDDSSTDATSALLSSYKYNGLRPVNLFICHLHENKKRGGACNRGVSLARGRWIVYLDCDDYFLENGLVRLSNILLSHDHLDILVYNYQSPFRSRCIGNLSTKEMSGDEFIQTQPVPWVSWCYAFKRQFLYNHKIKYEEKVYFEDCDYVISAILSAKRMQFIDESILFYSVYEGQTSTINSVEKVEDLLKLAMRLKCLGEVYVEHNLPSAQAIWSHQWFQYFSILKRYLWRLPTGEVKRLLTQYKPYDEGHGWLRIVPKFPLSYVCLAFVMKPPLLILSKFYRRYLKK